MEKFIKILKRGLRHLLQLVIAFVGLLITLIASVVAFPVYLCSLLSRNNKQSTNPPNNMMTHDYIEHQFCEYMFVQKLPTHKHIDIETVCRKMGVSSRDFKRYLNERLDTTFSEVVHECRIDEAKALWEESGAIPIRRIAHAVGYGNSLTFLFHFIRVTHYLPHVWKRKTLNII